MHSYQSYVLHFILKLEQHSNRNTILQQLLRTPVRKHDGLCSYHPFLYLCSTCHVSHRRLINSEVGVLTLYFNLSFPSSQSYRTICYQLVSYEDLKGLCHKRPGQRYRAAGRSTNACSQFAQSVSVSIASAPYHTNCSCTSACDIAPLIY